MSKKFNPAYDMPTTADEALAKLECWGDPLCMTFDPKHAKRMAELLAPAVGRRSADDHCMAIGSWLSAALDDPEVCAEMKADINRWFDAGKPQIEFPPDPGHQVYQLMSITDERYRHEQWKEVTYSEYALGKDRPFTASRILYTVPQVDDPADRAWRKWADDLRSAIGDREGWLTLTTHVRARGDSICFSGTTLVPPSD